VQIGAVGMAEPPLPRPLSPNWVAWCDAEQAERDHSVLDWFARLALIVLALGLRPHDDPASAPKEHPMSGRSAGTSRPQ